jgi:hypothetical protein
MYYLASKGNRVQNPDVVVCFIFIVSWLGVAFQLLGLLGGLGAFRTDI